MIEQIEIAETGKKGEEPAQKAWARLGSGESFESVARDFSRDGTLATLEYQIGM